MLGERIRHLRLEKGATQKDLSNYLGLTPKMVSFYETGKRFPSQAHISKIAKYFDVTTDYILGVSDVKTIAEEDELKRLKTQLENELDLLFCKQKDLQKSLETLDRSKCDIQKRLSTCMQEISYVQEDLDTLNNSIAITEQKLNDTQKKLLSISKSELTSKVDLVKKVLPGLIETLSEIIYEAYNTHVQNEDCNLDKPNEVIEFVKGSDFEVQLKFLSHFIKDIELDMEKKQLIITHKDY